MAHYYVHLWCVVNCTTDNLTRLVQTRLILRIEPEFANNTAQIPVVNITHIVQLLYTHDHRNRHWSNREIKSVISYFIMPARWCFWAQWRSQPDNLVLLCKYQIIVIVHVFTNWLFSQIVFTGWLRYCLGLTFSRWMIVLLSCFRRPSHSIRLNVQFRTDLQIGIVQKSG